MQVKIFYASEPNQVEKEINDWIFQKKTIGIKVEIKFINQTDTPDGYFTVSVWWEEKVF